MSAEPWTSTAPESPAGLTPQCHQGRQNFSTVPRGNRTPSYHRWPVCQPWQTRSHFPPHQSTTA
eukprot:2126864-Lingulodinium_polyedra.AAC.1